MSTQLLMERLTPILQGYSVLAVALAAGTNLSTTIITLPALLTAPSKTLATQWKVLFDHGITPVVTLAMSSSTGFAALAYSATYTPALTSPGVLSHAKRNLYVAAAVAAFGMAPYTKLLMYGNIGELERRAEGVKAGAGKGGDDGTHELVKTWGRYNFYRGCLLLASAGLGMCACLV